MPSWEKVRAIIMAAGTGAGRAMAIIIAIPTAILAGILLVAFLREAVDNPHVGTPTGGMVIAGPVMILGALAYRSVKKRKLGEVKSTFVRQVLEFTLLLLICLIILAQNNLKNLIATDPVPNLIIPLWAILAYLIMALMPKRLLGGPSA